MQNIFRSMALIGFIGLMGLGFVVHEANAKEKLGVVPEKGCYAFNILNTGTGRLSQQVEPGMGQYFKPPIPEFIWLNDGDYYGQFCPPADKVDSTTAVITVYDYRNNPPTNRKACKATVAVRSGRVYITSANSYYPGVCSVSGSSLNVATLCG